MADERFQNSTYADHEEELAALQALGFAINPLNKTVATLEEAYEYAQDINEQKADLPYGIDGVVIKLKNNTLSSALGVVGKTPRGWAAIKFAGEDVTTQVVGISWQGGRTGKVTPVVDLEPVELVGTTVKRATLHNRKEVIDSDLHLGDTVVIHKAGDIIPEVKSVLINLRPAKAKTLDIPTHCPSCGTKLELTDTEVDLVCHNLHCPAQIIARLTYFAQRSVANIQGLSEKNIEKFYELFGVEDIADLYDLPFDKIFELEGFGQKSVENLKTSLDNARRLSLVRFFAGLGIDGVGPEIAELIIRNAITSQPQKELQESLL